MDNAEPKEISAAQDAHEPSWQVPERKAEVWEGELHRAMEAGVHNVAAMSLELQYPTLASIPHSLVSGFKNVLALACETSYALEPAPPELPLASLPLEVLELICQSLSLWDRLDLVRCCRGLWARVDVAGSAALWGNLDIELSFTWRRGLAGKQASLCSWLARHRGAIRHLRLSLQGHPVDPGALLGSLAGSPRLAELELREMPDLGGKSCDDSADDSSAASSALEPLRHLTGLTQLMFTDCMTLRALPQGLSVLVSLASLRLHKARGLAPAGDAAFAPLQCLGGALTHLSLFNCHIERLPLALSVLSALRVLGLRWNPTLGAGGEAAFEPLRHMAALTLLDACNCGLQSVPPQVSALTGLLVLDLGRNGSLGAGDVDATFAPLQHLAALTSLSLNLCGLASAPPQLSTLSALVWLDLCDSSFGDSEAAALEPLRHLAALTALDLGSCMLRAVPLQLADLPHLQDLSLSDNPELSETERTGRTAGFGPLQQLGALTRLLMGYCKLGRVPPQVSALSRLKHLGLWGNPELGEAMGHGAFEPLQQLAALTHLNVRRCRLESLPPQLLALSALAHLDLRDNSFDEDAVQSELLQLTALTHVDFKW